MARSNGNQDRTGVPTGRPARAAQPVDHGLPWHNEPAYPNGQQAGYDPQLTGQPQLPGQLPWPPQSQPAYAGQQAYGQQPYGQPTQQPQPGYPVQPEAHHGHYFPAQTHAPQAPEYPPQNFQNAYQPNAPYPAAPAYPDPGQQLRGSYAEPAYGHPGSQTGGYPVSPYGQPGPHGQDPNGFDLGAYATPSHTQADHVPTGRPVAPPPPYAQQPQLAAPQHDEEDYDDEDYEDEEEEAPRRFGVLKVVASLVVAIALGGGVAYGFKKFGGNLTASTSKPVVVKADSSPAKTAPVNRVASTDDKGGERLGDAIPAVVPATETNSDPTAPAAARKVQTIAIPPASGAPLRPTISVPGVALEGLPQAPQQAPPMAAQLPPVTPAPAGRAVAPPPAAAQKAPIAPRVIAAAEVPAAAAPAKTAPAARVPVARPAKTNDAFSPAQGVGAATVATATTPPVSAPKAAGSNGYVAVLSSQATAIDARKTLDDLQTKYSDVLSGKPTDVTEATVNGKLYYRAVVGPPGSREAANSVCSQVKAAGHKDCFAVPY